jgi:hypothetical protein
MLVGLINSLYRHPRSKRRLPHLLAQLQTTIHTVHGLPLPLLDMRFFSTGPLGNPRVEHATTVWTVPNGNSRTPMIQIGTGLLRHDAGLLTSAQGLFREMYRYMQGGVASSQRHHFAFPGIFDPFTLLPPPAL